MKLRLDLLEHLKVEDFIEEAAETAHRFKPEPLFATTGKGYLRPATPEEKDEEIKRSAAFIARIMARAEADKQGQSSPPNS